MYIYPILFTHAFTNGLLSCFHIVAIGNSPAVNISMQVTVGTSVFISGLYRQSPLQAPSLWASPPIFMKPPKRFFFLLRLYLFIYFGPCWVCAAAQVFFQLQ